MEGGRKEETGEIVTRGGVEPDYGLTPPRCLATKASWRVKGGVAVHLDP